DIEPVRDEEKSGDQYDDYWFVYGTVDGRQSFSAKELTIQPGTKCRSQDPGASSWITVQGRDRIGSFDLQTPAMIRFGADTTDKLFISHTVATDGVEIENLGTERLVGLRYFGPDTHKNPPKAGS
ncbi:MAG: hypothetical protein HKN47_28080, partial [Pirellulaceae bacterium]|nr:hypothetical protein [Pirellulaceae bacterium]